MSEQNTKNTMEDKLDAITEAVTNSQEKTATDIAQVKESAKTEIKAVKEEAEQKIKSLENEIDEIKAKGNKMPTEKSKEMEIKEGQDLLFKSIKEGVTSGKINVQQSLFSEKGVTVDGADSAAVGIVEQLSDSILVQAREDYTILAEMKLITVQSVDYKKVIQNTYAGTQWEGENTDASTLALNDTPTFKTVGPAFGKITSRTFITKEAMRDAKYDLKSFLINDMKVEMGRAVAKAMIDGDGSNKPKGILAHFDATESVKSDETRSKEHFGYVSVTGGKLPEGLALINALRDLYLATKSPYLNGAKYFMNREVYDALSRVTDNNGVHYLQMDLSGKADGTLFGYPVFIEPFLPAAVEGSIPVIFGNLGLGFELIDWTSLEMLVNPYAAHGTVQFWADKRVGSLIGDSWAVKGLHIAT